MQLKVINSNSTGNAYVLENDHEALLIECGVRFDRIKQAMNFNMKKVVGCILTHCHGDHAASIMEVLKAGINVAMSNGTATSLEVRPHHRVKIVSGSGSMIKFGGFEIKPFDIEHDVPEPLGFLIRHNETGTVLFLTDTYYVKHTFPPLNNILIECNYAQDIIDASSKRFLRDRVIESHMNLDTCKKTLMANDLSGVNNIVLIHLSDSNSDAKRFKREIQEQTGKTVSIAEPGLSIPFNLQPF